MITSERTAREWFKDAEDCYLEKHQGCAWCGGSHRVFQFRHGPQLIYYCNACDFRVGKDVDKEEYFSVPGEQGDGSKKVTMLEL